MTTPRSRFQLRVSRVDYLVFLLLAISGSIFHWSILNYRNIIRSQVSVTSVEQGQTSFKHVTTTIKYRPRPVLNEHTITQDETVADEPETCQYLASEDVRSLNYCEMRTGNKYIVGAWQKTCHAELIAQDPYLFAYGVQEQEFLGRKNLSQYLGYGPETRLSNEPRDRIERAKMLTYSWFPNGCRLRAFSRDDARNLLSKRKLYFLGDSLIQEFRDSLSYLTGLDMAGFKSHTIVDHRTLEPMPLEQFIYCHCLIESYSNRQNNMTYQYAKVDYDQCRPFYLSNSTDKTEKELCPRPADKTNYHLDAKMYGWIADIQQYDTIIFAVGHHFYKLGDLHQTYPKMMHNLIQWFETKIYKDKWDMHLIYVIEPPGHPKCASMVEPQVSAMSNQEDRYSWGATFRMQQAWKDALQASFVLRNRSFVLDTSHMLLRGDAHMGVTKEGKEDCLHWPLPGPIDTWSQILMNLFKQIEDETE